MKLCRKCNKCPTAEIGKGIVVIEDDYGGKVKLTKEQAIALALGILD